MNNYSETEMPGERRHMVSQTVVKMSGVAATRPDHQILPWPAVLALLRLAITKIWLSSWPIAKLDGELQQEKQHDKPEYQKRKSKKDELQACGATGRRLSPGTIRASIKTP